VTYAQRTLERGAVSKVCLVHGDPQPQRILGQKLNDAGLADVVIPAPGDRLSF
jgi:hypothetical protein